MLILIFVLSPVEGLKYVHSRDIDLTVQMGKNPRKEKKKKNKDTTGTLVLE